MNSHRRTGAEALRTAATLALAAALALGAAPAVAVPWFPSDPGPTFTYEGAMAPTTISGNGVDFARGTNLESWPFLSHVEYFRVDPTGDILCRGTGSAATGMIDIYDYDPPLLYLDFPLEPGKTWSSQATLWPNYAGTPPVVTLTGRVVGSGPATVPAGTFDVTIVELTLTGQPYGTLPTTGYLFLHHQLGPVGGLVSWTGVVGIGPVSWGRFKVMYR